MFRKLLILLALLICAAPALAAGPKTFAVLPFNVHGPQEYQYLSQGVQSMLTSRLGVPGQLAPLDSTAIRQAATTLPTDPASAAQIHSALGVDYLIWGALTIMGKECSLDVNSLDIDGTNLPYPVQTDLDQVIPSLENVATAMSAQILGRSPASQAAPIQTAQPLNQGIVVNEARSDTAYANPSLKYQEMDTSMGRWRSPMFSYTSRGMVVCDGDGDGKNEVFVLTDNTLIAYRVDQGQMVKIAELDLPKNRNYLRLNSIDLNRNGSHELVISAVLNQDPRSLIVSFADNRLTIQADQIPLHLGVINLPPAFTPTLVGQKVGRLRYLDSTIHQVIKTKDNYDLGPALKLPRGGTVYNTTFLPEGDAHNIIIVDDRDHIRVYSATGTLLTVTEETYAGSNLGIDYHETAIGLGADKNNQAAMNRVFIPLRGIATNLDKDNRFELLISRNISVAAQFFSNYRDYPMGEIHCLYWDGVGMSLEWKTAQIKGTVTDYCLADLDNDGVLDLVVSINTHTGMVGTSHKKTMILAYPLDLGSVN